MENYKVIVHRASNTDELYHWKYIKKLPNPNGPGYRYFYAETDTKAAGKSRLDDMIGRDEKKSYETAKNTYDYYKTGDKFYSDRAIQLRNMSKYGIGDRPKGNQTDIGLSKIARENAHYERSHLDNTKKVADKALAEYKKTPLYKIEKAQEKLGRGKAAVLKALKKLSRKK